MLIAGRIDHVAIATADTEGMVKWYGRVLGLVIHAEGASRDGGQKGYLIGPPLVKGAQGRGIHHGSMIEVMAKNEAQPHARGSHDPGLSHIAWYVEDFNMALKHLRECNVRFLGEVGQAVGGGRIISFLDCDGNMMQIVERK